MENVLIFLDVFIWSPIAGIGGILLYVGGLFALTFIAGSLIHLIGGGLYNYFKKK